MPAEWYPHEATWLSWPHEESDWPGKFDAIPWVYGEIVRRLSRVERVCILVRDEEVGEQARNVLSAVGAHLEAVDLYVVKTDRSWIRDFGPIFVKSGSEVAITRWEFNGWAKYDNYKYDNCIVAHVCSTLKMPCFEGEIVLEGGSIDVNGAGVLLTTEECLLSDVQARNPGLSRQAIESKLFDYLGAERVVWLGNGIAGDDTHGHIDDLARFVNENTIVTVLEGDPSEANYEPTQHNVARLRSLGEFRIVTLPMPEPIYFEGQRLPASYANFYIANEIVLVPTFNDPNDRRALNILSEMFPTRQVVGIASSDLVLGLGTLHCMTQQQPKA